MGKFIETRDVSFLVVDQYGAEHMSDTLRVAGRGRVTTETRRTAEPAKNFPKGFLGVLFTGEAHGFEQPRQVEMAAIAIEKNLAMLTEADRVKVRNALAYTGGDRGVSRTGAAGITSNDQHDALTCGQADRIEEIQKMNDDFWKDRLAV